MNNNNLITILEQGKQEDHYTYQEMKKSNDVVFDYGIDGKIIIDNVKKKSVTFIENFGNLTFTSDVEPTQVFEYIKLKNDRIRPLTVEGKDINSNINHYRLELVDVKDSISKNFDKIEFEKNEMFVTLGTTKGKVVLFEDNPTFLNDDVPELSDIFIGNRNKFFELGQIAEFIELNSELIYHYFNINKMIDELQNQGEVILDYDFITDYEEEFEDYMLKKIETLEMFNKDGDCTITLKPFSTTQEEISVVHDKTGIVLFNLKHKYKSRTKGDLMKLLNQLTNII